MLIGLTGKYCAGKNHVAALLEKRGLPVLDVDKLGYQVLESEKEAIFSQFGNDLQKTNGSLDRRLLGKRVFGSLEKLAALEAIVHPAVNRLTEEWVSQQAAAQQAAAQQAADGTRSAMLCKACVINAALLHRSAVFNRLDHIILVRAPFLTRLLRAHRRDRLPWREILKRFASQKDFSTKYFAVNAEIHIVENPGLSGRKTPDRFDESCFSENLRRKLESRIDKVLEGIR